MLPPNVSSWDSFVFRGTKFLALFDGSVKVCIYDAGMHNYGVVDVCRQFQEASEES